MNRCRMPFESLLDYHDGRADDATAARIREHVSAGCPHCTGELASIEKTLSTMAAAEGVHAPEAVRQQAYSIFRERFTQPAKRSLLARLVFDGRQDVVFAGARGDQAATFQMLFSTDEHDIDLYQERTERGAWYLIGQILPKQGGDPIVPESAVFTTEGGRTLAATMEPGEFHLQDAPAGTYALRLVLSDAEVTLPEVVVGR
jgi:hypothetical protein